MNKKNISIIGGDMRIIRLAQEFCFDGYKVYTYGLEKSVDIQGEKSIYMCKNIEEVLNLSDIIISSIPFSKDGVTLNAPFAEKEIKILELLNENKTSDEKILIAGSISENLREKISDSFKVIDLMNSEKLTILNTIATAEGALDIAIQNTERNLCGSNILILGFGRVAKVVAKKFKALDANITCSARKEEDFAWMETFGYNKMNINYLDERLKDFDIIINTVPQTIINKKELEFMKKDVTIIDLASKPGGIDFNEAKKQNKKCIWALALPGKIAPKSSADFIKQEIYKIIK